MPVPPIGSLVVKRFRFRLERVLKLRQQRRRVAELALKQAALILQQARAVVSALKEDLRKKAESLETEIGSEMSAGAWLVHCEHAAQLERSLMVAENREQFAVDKVRDSAAVCTRLSAEVEALESLRRQQWQQHREGSQAEYQREMDALALIRWERVNLQGDV
jgi:flagellar export protein FliJ